MKSLIASSSPEFDGFVNEAGRGGVAFAVVEDIHNQGEPKGGNMFKKLFVAVAAAGALSVPLAGVAWADPPADGVGADGVGKGGIPKAIAAAAPDDRDRIPPGSEIRRAAKDDPEGSVPDYINHNTPFGRIGPGQLVKAYTPGHAPPPPQGGGSTVTPPPVSTPGTPDVSVPTTPETPAEPVPTTPATPAEPVPTPGTPEEPATPPNVSDSPSVSDSPRPLG